MSRAESKIIDTRREDHRARTDVSNRTRPASLIISGGIVIISSRCRAVAIFGALLHMGEGAPYASAHQGASGRPSITPPTRGSSVGWWSRGFSRSAHVQRWGPYIAPRCHLRVAPGLTSVRTRHRALGIGEANPVQPPEPQCPTRAL